MSAFVHRARLYIVTVGDCAFPVAEIIPADWKQAIIVPIFIKKMKDKLDCNNYRDVNLLCHYSKILTSKTYGKNQGKNGGNPIGRTGRFPTISEHHRSNCHAPSIIGEVY